MPQLLVGYGPHHAAGPTLRWAAGFAARGDLDLVVVHAVEQLDYEIDRDLWDRFAKRRQEEILQIVATVTDRPCSVEVLDGEPHEALLARSDQADVAFTVAGRHGTGGLGGFGGAGTALELIRHGAKPTIVVGADSAVADGPILVGVDGSAANQQALRVAEDLSGRLHASLVGVFCADPMADTFPHPEGWTYPHEDAVRAELERAGPVPPDLVITPGHPTETLLGQARERHAQLLVVGTRGRGGFHGLLAGRVAVQLIEDSAVPVVVVPHDR